MRRRDFFAVAAGAASYATATPAQQRLPVIAVLNAGSAASTSGPIERCSRDPQAR